MAVLGHILDLFLKVYELSLPGADSWVFVSETQNSTYNIRITCHAKLGGNEKKSLQNWEDVIAK